MIKAKKTAVTLACLVPLLVGCVGMPGQEPGAVPPRIVERTNDRNGQKDRVWDNPSAFGQVPDALKAKGNATCRAADFERASGYHPEARDQNGRTFPGGGFFCTGKRDKDNAPS